MIKISFEKIIEKFYKGDMVKPKIIPQKDDVFIKENINSENHDFCEKMINFLKNTDYQKFMNSVLTESRWSNSVDFVGFNFPKGKLEHISVGLWNDEIGETEIKKITIDDFMYIINNVTAVNIEKNPQEEKYYKQLYVDLLNKIKKAKD